MCGRSVAVGPRRTLFSAIGRILPALLVSLPAASLVVAATASASWTTLGRDQGIFQYIAWAVTQGEVLYRDVRDVNGPVVTMVHSLMLALGGADEHRFRLLDLGVNGLSFAVAGALLPSITEAAKVNLAERIGWALAAWVALSAQYLVYGWWDTAQRESFLDWFVLVSIALQATRASSGDPRSRTTKTTLLLAGLLSFVPWLGKPTFALFTVIQIGALLLERFALRDRLRRLVLFLAGGAVGVALPLAFVVLRGDLRAWLRISFVDVPAMYRFIWPLPPSAILSFPGYASTAEKAALTTVALVVLVLLRRLPLRLLPLAAMPSLGVVSVIAQAKGFPYHFHPATLGTTFAWLALLAIVWETLPFPTARRGLVYVQRVFVLVAALLLSSRSGYLAWLCPDPPAPPPEARDTAALESAARLAAFDRIDFFPRAMRDAAEYVARVTGPDDRVQLYAMDPYLLFLARRRSATPYIYAYDLNVDAALHGSFDPDGPVPSPDERARIAALQTEHASDLQQRVERRPPAAFVFADRSPLMTEEDAIADFTAHCPDTATWMREHYRQAAQFDGFRVWLRADLASR